MLELREWIASSRFEERPWLVLGKGPTFSQRGRFDLTEYNLLGLNHVVAEAKVDVAHIVDVDVVPRVADHLADNCRFLLMPRRPHVDFQACDRLLEDYFDDHPVLRRLGDEGRLVWYNAATGKPVSNSPVIHVSFFSSEAAIDILGEMGVRTVRTLGVDGGRSYASEFAGLPSLGNGLPSFDAQFREIEEIVRDRGIDFDPLIEPMRVFVGVDESQIVAARALEYTIRAHASRPVRFIPMEALDTPVPRDPANRARTAFSFSRFHIPQLAGYRGRALYLDADMQVFADIAELWDMPFGEHRLLCTRQDEPPHAWKDSSWFHPGRQMSVMLLDCDRLDWRIEEIIGGLDRGEYGYADLLFNMCIVPDGQIGDHLPAEWNHLEHYEEGRTKLLHYTVVPTQPWKTDVNPLGHLWEEAFSRARDAGIIRRSEIRQAAGAGHIRRSLAGLPPARKGVLLARKGMAKLERGFIAAERRFPVLRHPAVGKLRHKVGSR